MKKFAKHTDTGSAVTIATTLVLFLIAVFLKGFTHDLLLEAGVFLVSVKLILMSYKNSVSTESLHRELAEIQAQLDRLESLSGRSTPPEP